MYFITWDFFTTTACQYVSLIVFILGFFMVIKPEARILKGLGTFLCLLAVGAMTIKFLIENGFLHV